MAKTEFVKHVKHKCKTVRNIIGKQRLVFLIHKELHIKGGEKFIGRERKLFILRILQVYCSAADGVIKTQHSDKEKSS